MARFWNGVECGPHDLGHRCDVQADQYPQGNHLGHFRRQLRWGGVFGDQAVAASMIDQIVHHADVISLKGDSYRLKDHDLYRVPAAAADEK